MAQTAETSTGSSSKSGESIATKAIKSEGGSDLKGSSSSKGKKMKQNDPRIINVTGKKKPEIKSVPRLSSLHDRLSSFLPELASANASLHPDDNLEQVKDDQYINMDLGLGVLEHVDSDDSSDTSDGSSDASNDSSERDEPPTKRAKTDELLPAKTARQDMIQEV